MGRGRASKSKGGGKRLDSVNSLIQKDLSRIIRREIELPAGSLITVTKVRTGPDLKAAGIYVSIMPEEKKEEIFSYLVKSKNILQQELVKNLKTKFSPRIEFVYDQVAAKAGRIEQILDGLATDK